jgi:RNA polymerase-interacting CarD/CdnL/TRCF family regulator
MEFQVGDDVIHRIFGYGEITNIEDRIINESEVRCYVVQLTNMTIWVPADIPGQNSLRNPTPPKEFNKIINILTSPYEIMEEDRLLRKKHLQDQLRDGQLSSICQVVRDLTHYKQSSKLNDQEKKILEHAIDSLLTEWSHSLEISLEQAKESLQNLLQVQTNNYTS